MYRSQNWTKQPQITFITTDKGRTPKQNYVNGNSFTKYSKKQGEQLLMYGEEKCLEIKKLFKKKNISFFIWNNKYRIVKINNSNKLIIQDNVEIISFQSNFKNKNRNFKGLCLMCSLVLQLCG